MEKSAPNPGHVWLVGARLMVIASRSIATAAAVASKSGVKGKAAALHLDLLEKRVAAAIDGFSRTLLGFF
jgi:hypothetical protein